MSEAGLSSIVAPLALIIAVSLLPALVHAAIATPPSPSAAPARSGPLEAATALDRAQKWADIISSGVVAFATIIAAIVGARELASWRRKRREEIGNEVATAVLAATYEMAGMLLGTLAAGDFMLIPAKLMREYPAATKDIKHPVVLMGENVQKAFDSATAFARQLYRAQALWGVNVSTIMAKFTPIAGQVTVLGAKWQGAILAASTVGEDATLLEGCRRDLTPLIQAMAEFVQFVDDEFRPHVMSGPYRRATRAG